MNDNKNPTLAVSKDGTIKYQLITQEYVEPALTLLAESFFRHENICAAINLADNPEAVQELVELTRSLVKQGVTVVAIDKGTNKVAGAAFNEIKVKESEEARLKFENSLNDTCKSPKFVAISDFISDAENLVDLFELCEVDCLMEILFLSTSSDYRGKGIGKKLSEISIEIARKLSQGVNVKQSVDGSDLSLEPAPKSVYSIFSSFITQKIGKDLGFKIAAEINFKDSVLAGVNLGSRIGSHTTKATIEYIKFN